MLPQLALWNARESPDVSPRGSTPWLCGMRGEHLTIRQWLRPREVSENAMVDFDISQSVAAVSVCLLGIRADDVAVSNDGDKEE